MKSVTTHRKLRSLRATYVLALTLLAALSLTTFAVMHTVIRQQAGSAAIIDRSGMQRTLSQRTALFAQQLVTQPPSAERERIRLELQQDINVMLHNHDFLLKEVRGDPFQYSPATLSALQQLYFRPPHSLDAQVKRHGVRIEAILATPDEQLSPDLPALRDLMRESTGELLATLDTAVHIHTAEAERRVSRLQRIETGVLVVTLLTLLLEALLIFRPMDRELRRRSDQLHHEAFHDSLTGLPNRALFMERLGQAIVRYRRFPAEHYSVLFLDLDRFKAINDSLGHDVGDALLIELARRLKDSVRTLDTVARLGGDEFTVLLESLSAPQDVKVVCERIGQAIAAPFELGGHTLRVTASIGIVSCDADGVTAHDVLKDADLAMYRAKALGRARTESFKPELRSQPAPSHDLRSAERPG